MIDKGMKALEDKVGSMNDDSRLDLSDMEEASLGHQLSTTKKVLAGNKEELEILEINFQTLEETYELKLKELSTTKADLNKAIEVIENLLSIGSDTWQQSGLLYKDAQAFLHSMKGRE